MSDQAILLATIGDVRYWSGTTIGEIISSGVVTIGDIENSTIADIERQTIAGLCAYEPITSIEDMTIWELCGFKDNTVLVAEDVTVAHAIEERSTANFTIKDDGALYNFEQGQEVILEVAGPQMPFVTDRLFGGVIQEVAMTSVKDDYLFHAITATDYHYIAESKLFAKAYIAPTAGQIVDDILDDELAEEGVTEGNIQTGDTLEDLTFNYLTCAEALDKVAELTGFTWWIDEHKALFFVDRTTYAADWQITTGDEPFWAGLTVSHCNPEYRNVQYISGGKAKTATRTESFKGDSTQQTFTVGFPIVEEPTLSINSVPVAVGDIGIKGVELSKKWYWTDGDPSVYQDEDETALTSSQTLSIAYIGSYPIMALATQNAEITNWASKCGYGTGRIEKLFTDSKILNKDAALDRAKSKLLHYATLGRKIEYTTRTWGLAAGTMQTVTLAVFGLTAVEMLISSIHMTFDAYGPLLTVTALEGPVDGSWETIFCQLAADARRSAQDAAGEESIVQGLESFTKNWLSSMHPNPFLAVYPGTATPADVDFPCLSSDDRYLYLVLFTGGVEFFRKVVADVTDTSATVSLVVAIVLANEANDTLISHAAIYGGNLCTGVAATGIEIHKEAYIKLKNRLESLQLEFTETRGW